MICSPPFEICESCEHIETHSDIDQHELLKIKSNSNYDPIPINNLEVS